MGGVRCSDGVGDPAALVLNQHRTARSSGSHIESEVVELEVIGLNTMTEDAKDMARTYGKQPPASAASGSAK